MKLTKDVINLPDTIIGEYTYGVPIISRSYSGCKLEIGKFCSIGTNVTIAFWGKHSMVDITTYPFEYLAGWPIVKGSPIDGEDIYIGNDVWIANNVLIMQGAHIEDGAVIGANSVVAGHFNPYALVVGNPAKQIKKRFTENNIEQLLKIKWWDWPVEEIKQYLSMIRSPNISKLYEVWKNEIYVYSSSPSALLRCKNITLKINMLSYSHAAIVR